ncbi:hypothetical protein GCM10023093_02100 [Nemorincola caseinilytica]|uniref:Uncharacterized protein n=1 Tax=Nemorincola caseinilytica TaxID=2054315 RepID=A0ABP8N6N5_9BACT
MNRKSLINDPQFLAGLALLLLNDLWLKWQFHNWFTGKLSDVVGLYIFPVFLWHFFPRARLQVYWFTAILFTFWKSTLSDGFIHMLHAMHLPFSRVADLTDLLALAALPLSYRYCGIADRKWRYPATGAVAVAAALVFCSDSIAFRRLPRPKAQVHTDIALLKQAAYTPAQLRTRLQAAGLTCYDDSVSTGWFYYDTSALSPAPLRRHVREVPHFLRIRGFGYGSDSIHNINCYLHADTSGAWLQVWSYDIGPAVPAGHKEYKRTKKKYDALIREHLLPQ